MPSEEDLLEEFVLETEKLEPVAHAPSGDWQDWIPQKLRPSTAMGLAMTKHFINTPADERV
jgi:hypothetical protein